MAGYYGYSMSNNAISAYNDGEKPISKWNKKEIIEAIENSELELICDIVLLKKLPVKALKETVLFKSSWHHTSNHYNKTDFYSLDADRIEEITNAEIQAIMEDIKSENKPKEQKEEKYRCTFLEWSGSRKHPKATEITEIGIVKGNWFYRTNGTKKSTTANGFKFIEKI